MAFAFKLQNLQRLYMNSYPCRLVAILLLLSTSVFSQRLKKADRAIASNIQNHMAFFNGGQANPRSAGTNGEKLATDYIRNHFSRAGLKPGGDSSSWFQTFEIYDGREVLPATELVINGKKLRLYEDYFPFAFSANKKTGSAVAIALAENGVPWFKDLRELTDGDEGAKVDTAELIRIKAQKAAEKGATALIIYNSAGNDLQFDKFNRATPVSIPVIYITRQAFEKHCSDESAILDISLNVSLKEKIRQGNNIIGFADNHADSTIVAGASLEGDTGVATLLEVARLMKNQLPKNRNYLLVAWYGENNGEAGKKYFTQHPSINMHKADDLISLDTIKVDGADPKGLLLVKRSIEVLKNR